MPPKPKYTKEQIVSAALKVVSQKGVQALTAKELGQELKTSTTPIFTVFNSMQEVHAAVKIAAMKRFESYTRGTAQNVPVFKQIGMQMILFAKEEPKLYQLLFMQESKKTASFDELFKVLGKTALICVEAVEHDYGLSVRQAKVLFENVWIYTFGVGALCAAGACCFSEDEIGQMLSTQFQAMLMLIKSEAYDGKSTENECER